MSQLEFLRDVDYPTRMEIYRKVDAVLKSFSSRSEENARIAKEDIFGIENNIKRFIGYQEGLHDRQTMGRKATEEQKLQAIYKANAKNAGTPDPWQGIANAMKVERSIYKTLTFVERMRGFNSDLVQFARTLVRVTEEKTKPNGERLREYRDSSLPSLEQRLFSTAPIYKSLETVELATSLAQMEDILGSDDEFVKKTLNGKTPDQAAQELIANTRLEDVALRKQLYQGGVEAIQSSNDPLVVLMRSIDPDARRVRKQYDDEVDAVERRDGAAIARARFEKTGFTEPPDATFTLRLSYGAVKGYAEKGKHIAYFTTIGGAFQHAAEHGNKDPYRLPDSWRKAKSKLKLYTPLNFVSTADIIGGNSGSPTINKAGEVVGIIFDGNLETLPWNFAYSDKQARAVQVDSRGIQEALRKVYGANALADELMGKAPTTKVVVKDGIKGEQKKAAPPK
jgi:hypothetical protein